MKHKFFNIQTEEMLCRVKEYFYFFKKKIKYHYENLYQIYLLQLNFYINRHKHNEFYWISHTKPSQLRQALFGLQVEKKFFPLLVRPFLGIFEVICKFYGKLVSLVVSRNHSLFFIFSSITFSTKSKIFFIKNSFGGL